MRTSVQAEEEQRDPEDFPCRLQASGTFGIGRKETCAKERNWGLGVFGTYDRELSKKNADDECSWFPPRCMMAPVKQEGEHAEFHPRLHARYCEDGDEDKHGAHPLKWDSPENVDVVC